MKRSSAVRGLVTCLTRGLLGALTIYIICIFSSVSISDNPPPASKDYRKQYVASLQSLLKLESKQITELDVIVKETSAKLRELPHGHSPELDVVVSLHNERIRSILRRDQQVKYDSLLKERKANQQH